MLNKLKALAHKYKQKDKKLLVINNNKDIHPSTSNDPNTHIKEYLRYYLSLEHSPYFAVLVSGVWGIGKTHLVKSIAKDLLIEEPYSYVSLYGVENLDDIDVAVYQSLYPILASTGAKILGRAGKAAMKYGRIDGAVRVGDFVNPSNDRLYVFDDLERCAMKLETVLGYINELVEHDGCKVIIIANEQKLLEIGTYKDTREKLIGKSLEVQPAADSVLNYFLDQVSSATAKEILGNNLDTISTIFREARAKNFRVLQQTIWDFERLANCLQEHHIKNSAGIRALVSLFFSISIEVKSGFISQQEILDRPSSLMRAMTRARKDHADQSLDIAQKNFSEANLFEPMLSNQIISDVLFKGMVNQDLVRASIDQSTYYINIESEPAWRTVWHAFERSDNDFNTALIEMERQFQTRELKDPGVILHIVGMKLWLSEIKVLSTTREEVLAQARLYIDDLYTNKSLPPKSSRSFNHDFYHGYGGLGIYEINSDDFRDFINFLESKQIQVEIDCYPEKAKLLLDEMVSDSALFYRRINWTNDEENIYAATPLLATISPKEFVERVIGLQGDDQRKIIAALNSRYSSGYLEKELSEEKNWLLEVINEFYSALESLTPVRQWGISGALKHYLDPLITE